MKNQIEMINLSDIVPDKEQPRRNFNPYRLAELTSSIKKHGVLSPLTLEKIGSKYLLIDGERRFRACKELKLKQVPAIIQTTQSAVDRLVQQFHLQEQHEGWTATEKAVAVDRLAKELKIGVREICRMLDLPDNTIRTYLTFSSLLAKKEFEKSEISIEFANNIKGMKNLVKHLYKREFDEVFTRKDEEMLELALIRNLKSGNIQKKQDFGNLKDSFVTKPETIKKFLKAKGTNIDILFKETKGNSAKSARQTFCYGGYFLTALNDLLKLKAEPYYEQIVGGKTRLNEIKKRLDRALNTIEK